jgi:hypothetical protein
MALGLETVTTAMPECRKYPYVHVAENHAEFIGYLQSTVTVTVSNTHRNDIVGYARENHSWRARAKEIDALLRQKL